MQIGEVEAVSYTLTTPLAGVIQWATSDGEKIPVFADVKKGQVIAGLDDHVVRTQIHGVKQQVLAMNEFATARLVELDNPLEVGLARVAGPRISDEQTDSSDAINARAEAWQALSSFAGLSMKRIRHCELKLELRKIEARLRTLQPASSGSAATAPPAPERIRIQTERLKVAGEIQRLAIEIAAGETSAAEEIAEVDIDHLAAADEILFRQRSDRSRLISEQLASIAAMSESLDIISPASGQVSKTFVQARQTVQQGLPVATVTPSTGTWVVVYSREHGIVRPFPGMPVTISLLRDPSQRFTAAVESIGPRIESVPGRQRANSRIEEWGRPMRIAVPANVVLPPGSLVRVAFELE